MNAFSDWLWIIKGFFYVVILIFTSFYDLRTKTIPDIIHLLIFLIALIKVDLAPSILGFIFVPLPFLIPALMKENSIGGGDIKFMAVSGFLLGFKRGVLASIIGLILAVIVSSIYYKVNKIDKSESFPLAPFLSIGCFVSYLIM